MCPSDSPFSNFRRDPRRTADVTDTTDHLLRGIRRAHVERNNPPVVEGRDTALSATETALAQRLFQEGRFEEYLEHVSLEVREWRTSPDVCRLLAHALKYQGDFEAAFEVIEHAVGLHERGISPDSHIATLVTKAEIALAMDRVRLAWDILGACLDSGSAPPSAYYNRLCVASVARRRDWLETAVEDLLPAIRAGATDAWRVVRRQMPIDGELAWLRGANADLFRLLTENDGD